MDYQKACRSLRICDAVFGKSYIKWFLCFGNLLHLIRDKSIEPDKDIDVGIFYEYADPDIIIRGMKQWNYNVDSRIDNDIDHKPFNLSFKNAELPPIDVFFWYKHGKIRYHTYDVRQEKRVTPKEYYFKGVEAKFLPDPEKRNMDDPRLIKTFFGPHGKPYFQFEVPIPLFYGSLLDTWYPNWLKPQKMESISPYVVTMKTCGDWQDEKHIETELEKNKATYYTRREQLK